MNNLQAMQGMQGYGGRGGGGYPSPYDRSIWSTYTPLSAQEILQPAMMMQQQHQEIDSEYANIDDELQKIAFIAETSGDPYIQQMYQNYESQLRSGMDSIMDRGVTPSSRRRMMGLRSQYQSQIAPIGVAHEIKSQAIQQHIDRMQDPTYFGEDPNNISLSQILEGGLQPLQSRGMSGALLSQMAADQYADYAKVFNSRDGIQIEGLLQELGINTPMYHQMIMRRGFDPASDEFKPIKEAIENKILQSTRVSDWATPDQIDQAKAWISQGESKAIGETTVDIRDNKAWGWYADMKKSMLKNPTNTDLPEMLVQPGIAQTFKKRIEEINTDYSTLIDYYNNESSTSLNIKMGNPREQAAYKEAVRMHKEFKDKTDAEILEHYIENPFEIETLRSGVAKYTKDVNLTDTVIEYINVLRDHDKYVSTTDTISKKYNVSKSEAEQMAQQYIDSTSVVLGTVYEAASEALSKGESHRVDFNKRNMFQSNKHQVYVNGKLRNRDLHPEVKDKMVKDAVSLGHGRYSTKTGQSYVAYEYTPTEGKLKGKTIRVETPDVNFSNDYKDTINILTTIQKGNSPDRKKVHIEGYPDAEVYSDYVKEAGQWVHLVDLGDGKGIPIDMLFDIERKHVEQDFYRRSQTASSKNVG